jgi:ABC-type multidrug transport system fused ATPase/permease subunit
MALVAAAAGTVCEALLFRAFFDLARHLKLTAERMAALAAMLVFLGALLALDWGAALYLLRLGRHLELRLRTRFQWKIPRLADRYFQSRLISDMAFRAHALHLLRELPDLAGRLVRLAASLAVTAGAIAWFYPEATIPALCAAAAGIVLPLLFQPAIIERDLRFREFSGADSRFYLDALLGSRAIQAHGAARALRVEQAWQLGQWADAGLRRHSLLLSAEALQLTLTLALGIALVWRQAATAQQPAALLLLVYWAVSIPAIGRQFASFAWGLPELRNTLLRFLEPLSSPEEGPAESSAVSPAKEARGVRIEIDHVTAVAGGHVILDDLTFAAAPGEHIAVVGPSGAGKSSLVGLLLGWLEPSRGTIRVGGAPLNALRLAQLRQETAWIDPQVHLFNATLFENLGYGNGAGAAGRMGRAVETAGLGSVLERLPDGLQTPLGDGGALVSGGEGQRVRIGRALARPGVRLAILDEPARGLDRDQRREIVRTARRSYAASTLLCVTHDVTDTLDFDRVLVIEAGRIVEDGPPRRLYAESGSRYRDLLDQEKAVDRQMWSHPMWRRLRMTRGIVSEAAEVREWTSA